MNHICPAPWISVDATNRNYRPCCWYQDPKWPKFHSVEQYWNSDELDRLRKDFLEGQQPSGCDRCWNNEQHGVSSLRQDLLAEYPYPKWEPNARLEKVKLNTGDTCNLACMMCFDTVSSTHQNLWKGRSFPILPENKKQQLVYDEYMHQWIVENHRSIRYLDVLGGESLFSWKFLELIDFLVDQKSAQDITLYLTTNSTICTDRILEKLKSFKKVVIIASIDGVGAVNEYQRWGSAWTTVEKNIDTFREIFDVTIVTTVTALNVCRLQEIDDWADRRGLLYRTHSPVSGWPDLLPGNLPVVLQDRVTDRYRNLLNFKKQDHKLMEFIQHWDQARGISICNYLPEWQTVL